MLVEDNPDDQELALRALNRPDLHAHVDVAADGVEAVAHLHAADAVLPAFVLLDLKLPRLDGFDVLQRVREDVRTSLLPVIVFTSSGERADVQRCYELRCNSYVQKPVEATSFTATVRDIGLYWLGRNEALAD